MMEIADFIDDFFPFLGEEKAAPWQIISNISKSIVALMGNLGQDYDISADHIAIHKSAIIEPNVMLKAPLIIGKNCFVGSNAYLRGGVLLQENVKVGPGCEIKSSIICSHSALAHFNFIGDSIIGHHVNFEAGAIVANHYNERENKSIFVWYNGQIIDTKTSKFGALVGDHSKIGANAVLSPGTILGKNAVVKRLELIAQINE